MLIAIISTLIAGLISFWVAKWTVKHSANYDQRFQALNDELKRLTDLQEGQLQFQRQTRIAEKIEKERARWKPVVTIRADEENLRNELIFKADREFSIRSLSLQDERGAHLVSIPFGPPEPSPTSTGFRIAVETPTLRYLTNYARGYDPGSVGGRIAYTLDCDGRGYEGYLLISASPAVGHMPPNGSLTSWVRLAG